MYRHNKQQLRESVISHKEARMATSVPLNILTYVHKHTYHMSDDLYWLSGIGIWWVHCRLPRSWLSQKLSFFAEGIIVFPKECGNFKTTWSDHWQSLKSHQPIIVYQTIWILKWFIWNLSYLIITCNHLLYLLVQTEYLWYLLYLL